MKKIVVIGEILVEIMADTIGNGFRETLALTGPFPSGAPAIFADQAAKLGQPVAIVSAVGDDDFGHLNLERLRRDGVDVSAVHVDRDRPTGSAFVRYRDDGARNFVFNIRHSAAGHLQSSEAVAALLKEAQHLHIMGSSLSSAEFIDLNILAAETVKARGGSVSFDPNVRPEILSADGMVQAMERLLTLTDLYMPSGSELTLLTSASDHDAAVTELLARGVVAIVHKEGAQGATFYDANDSCRIAAFPVDEVDPTGAGDCFGATFATFWLRGASPEEALRYAAASGALAVTKRGPMEGAATRAELDRFLESAGTTQ